MSWKQFITRFNPDSLIDSLTEVFQSIVEIWAVLRVTIILALVLYTIVINLHANFDERCDDENLDTINSTICGYHVCWGIGH